MARNSVKIGIAMLAAWLVPLLGIILAVAGLVLGINSYLSKKDDLARAGIFLNSLGLFLATANLSVSLYFLLSGEIDPQLMLEQLN
ncbi:MAG: hypothetical protein ACQES4_06850 [Bacillota bacterium]